MLSVQQIVCFSVARPLFVCFLYLARLMSLKKDL